MFTFVPILLVRSNFAIVSKLPKANKMVSWIWCCKSMKLHQKNFAYIWLWMNRKYWKKDACFLHLTFSCSLLEDEWPSALVAWQEKSPAAFFVTLCKTRLRLDTMIPDAMSSERGLSCKNKYQKNEDGFKRINYIFFRTIISTFISVCLSMQLCALAHLAYLRTR